MKESELEARKPAIMDFLKWLAFEQGEEVTRSLLLFVDPHKGYILQMVTAQSQLESLWEYYADDMYEPEEQDKPENRMAKIFAVIEEMRPTGDPINVTENTVKGWRRMGTFLTSSMAEASTRIRAEMPAPRVYYDETEVNLYWVGDRNLRIHIPYRESVQISYTGSEKTPSRSTEIKGAIMPDENYSWLWSWLVDSKPKGRDDEVVRV